MKYIFFGFIFVLLFQPVFAEEYQCIEEKYKLDNISKDLNKNLENYKLDNVPKHLKNNLEIIYFLNDNNISLMYNSDKDYLSVREWNIFKSLYKWKEQKRYELSNTEIKKANYHKFIKHVDGKNILYDRWRVFSKYKFQRDAKYLDNNVLYIAWDGINEFIVFNWKEGRKHSKIVKAWIDEVTKKPYYIAQKWDIQQLIFWNQVIEEDKSFMNLKTAWKNYTFSIFRDRKTYKNFNGTEYDNILGITLYENWDYAWIEKLSGKERVVKNWVASKKIFDRIEDIDSINFQYYATKNTQMYLVKNNIEYAQSGNLIYSPDYTDVISLDYWEWRKNIIKYKNKTYEIEGKVQKVKYSQVYNFFYIPYVNNDKFYIWTPDAIVDLELEWKGKSERIWWDGYSIKHAIVVRSNDYSQEYIYNWEFWPWFDWYYRAEAISSDGSKYAYMVEDNWKYKIYENHKIVGIYDEQNKFKYENNILVIQPREPLYTKEKSHLRKIWKYDANNFSGLRFVESAAYIYQYSCTVWEKNIKKNNESKEIESKEKLNKKLDTIIDNIVKKNSHSDSKSKLIVYSKLKYQMKGLWNKNNSTQKQYIIDYLYKWIDEEYKKVFSEYIKEVKNK